MGTATRKLGDGTKGESWHVRNEQGEIFGPVDLDALRSWACDGRLAPTNEVSENGSEWQLATAVRALEMDWVAEVTPGTFYGPIHRRAMEELIKDGSISAKSFFFIRRGMDERPDQQAEAAQAERLRHLAEQAEQARQRAASSDEQTCQVRSQVAAYAAQVEQMRQQQAAQAEHAQRQVGSFEEQLRLAQQQVAAYEEQLRLVQQQAAALATQAEQARQQASAAEEHRRVTVQQMAEQARQQASVAEERLCAAMQQMAEQAAHAEQAQRLVLSKAEAWSDEVARLRKEHAESVEHAAELRAERDVRAAALETQTRAFEAERQGLHAALSHVQAEAEIREARLSQLEKALAGTAGVGAECGALESQVRSLDAERTGLQQALTSAKDAARQAEERCAKLEAVLEEAQSHRANETAWVDVSAELTVVRRLVEELFAQFRQATEANAAREAANAARVVERVTAETVEVEVLPPEQPRPSAKMPEAERVAPEWHRKPAETTPPAPNPGRVAPGLSSLADLEQQARRELERLGAQGANIFKRKK